MSNKIIIAADHAGFEGKEKMKSVLDDIGVEYVDIGTNSSDSVDYPDFAAKAAEAVAKGEYEKGILFCGSGTGMAIAANKIHGARAAVAWSPEIAALSRQHNNANILALPARFLTDEQAAKVVKAWFAADFEGGRHERRIEKITHLEEEN